MPYSLQQKDSVTVSAWTEPLSESESRLDLCFQVADTNLAFRGQDLEVIEKSVIGKRMSLADDLNRFESLKALVANESRLKGNRICRCVGSLSLDVLPQRPAALPCRRRSRELVMRPESVKGFWDGEPRAKNATRTLFKGYFGSPHRAVFKEKDSGGASRILGRKRPDAAFFEANLPELDGIDLASRIINDQRSRSKCIVLVTAVSMESDVLESLKRVDWRQYASRIFEHDTKNWDWKRLRLGRDRDELKPSNRLLDEEVEGLGALK